MTTWDDTVVTAQPSRGRGERWAYVIDRPGWWPYVSEARYGSEESALAAGDADVALAKQLIAEGVITDDD